ncbi:MAG: F0F1 ATP synthase subunit B [Candidatus Sumerlaeia bacterium]|nr:F0F1 ATP synthase subunit B [Candidatus Sumerlaeia bacterium]
MNPETLKTLSQILTQLVAFLIFLAIMKKYAWGPILRLLDERRERIAGEFQRIESTKAETERLRAEYEARLRTIEQEARERIQEAVSEGRRVAQEIREKAHSEARAITAKAKANIELEIEKARVQLKEDMIRMTMAALERVLRETVSREQHDRLIAQFIERAGKN